MKITYIRPMYPLDKMNGSEDVDWCRCYQSDDYSENYFVLHDCKSEAVRVDGHDDESAEAMDHLAARVNPDYDPEIDAEEQAISRMHRCGCLSCPWNEVCGAMNDDPCGEIYRVEDGDGDVTYYVEDDDLNIEPIDESEVYYPLTANENPLPYEIELARLFCRNHFENYEAD